MIALLNESVLWWHWIIFGVVLLILEMTTGTFFMLGLGIAAIIVGVIDKYKHISFTVELSIWMIFSIITILIWYLWFRGQTVSDSGQSNYKLDTLGTVTKEILPTSRGKVKFDTPVLGNSSWHATSKVEIPKDTRIEIIQVNGQLIEVKPTQNA